MPLAVLEKVVMSDSPRNVALALDAKAPAPLFEIIRRLETVNP